MTERWRASVQFSAVTQSCPTPCCPMDCSMPNFPVHDQFPEFTQTHFHWVSHAIHHLILCQPLLLPPSIFPRIRVFSNESVLLIRWSKYSNFSFSISPSNEYSGLISFRMDLFDLLVVQGTLKSLFQHHSSKASILRCSALLNGPTLTSIHDWSHKIQRRLLLGRKAMSIQESILKIRDIALPTKVRLVKAMVFPVVSHVWMWELDHKESWGAENWCFWTVVLEKTLESPLDCQESQPVNPKGNESWIFIGRPDAAAETPILWPPDVNNWLIRKDPVPGKDWRL